MSYANLEVGAISINTLRKHVRMYKSLRTLYKHISKHKYFTQARGRCNINKFLVKSARNHNIDKKDSHNLIFFGALSRKGGKPFCKFSSKISFSNVFEHLLKLW